AATRTRTGLITPVFIVVAALVMANLLEVCGYCSNRPGLHRPTRRDARGGDYFSAYISYL
ncbi:MAG: hypothetical protein AB1896_01050, partial [Thermodesulfobacteriota bacterium]